MDTGVMVSIIAAMASNRVIGREGGLPWRLGADKKYFRRLTENHTVIVGRKTHESIVKELGGPLPNRKTIVITRQNEYQAQGVVLASSYHAAIEMAVGVQEVFVIGGADVYLAALPKAHRLYLTRVHAQVEGDTFFPEVDWSQWKRVSAEFHPADDKNEYPFTLEFWERRGK